MRYPQFSSMETCGQILIQGLDDTPTIAGLFDFETAKAGPAVCDHLNVTLQMTANDDLLQKLYFRSYGISTEDLIRLRQELLDWAPHWTSRSNLQDHITDACSSPPDTWCEVLELLWPKGEYD